jgi:MFS family permease
MPLFGFPIQQMLPVFAKDVFDSPEKGLGWLGAAAGIGGLVGAMISANLENQPQKGRMMFIGGLLMGGFILAFAAAQHLLVGMLFLAAMGVGQMLFQATNNTTIQSKVPPEVRGRVMSIMMMSFGLMPLGVVPVTIAADYIGAQASLAISAACLLVVLLLMWGGSARLRNLRVDALGRAELSPVRAAELLAQGKITEEEADRLTGQVRKRGASPVAGG